MRMCARRRTPSNTGSARTACAASRRRRTGGGKAACCRQFAAAAPIKRPGRRIFILGGLLGGAALPPILWSMEPGCSGGTQSNALLIAKVLFGSWGFGTRRLVWSAPFFFFFVFFPRFRAHEERRGRSDGIRGSSLSGETPDEYRLLFVFLKLKPITWKKKRESRKIGRKPHFGRKLLSK